ncbi:hypothetical protein ABZW30_36565 [Kitasatospora sp. NPDC004669]|uniref:hypothetical protein n=1 Tax=Kitasatospora sp. NPDC004669 TaxID=3154555 RepID=UPI0033A71500
MTRGWGWLPIATALAVVGLVGLVGLVAVRMPVGVMGTLVRVLPAEHELARHVAPGVPWLSHLLVRGGKGGERR